MGVLHPGSLTESLASRPVHVTSTLLGPRTNFAADQTLSLNIFAGLYLVGGEGWGLLGAVAPPRDLIK